MYPQLSLINGPVLNVSTNSKFGNSSQRLAHSKGFDIPVVPTQYEISTILDSSSNSAKSSIEMLLLSFETSRTRGCWDVARWDVAIDARAIASMVRMLR